MLKKSHFFLAAFVLLAFSQKGFAQEKPHHTEEEVRAFVDKFVKKKGGKPTNFRGDAFVCPRSGPCIIRYDFAYVIWANQWRNHYIIDIAYPSPLSSKVESAGEVYERVWTLINLLLQMKGVEVAYLDHTIMPDFVGQYYMRRPVTGTEAIVRQKLPGYVHLYSRAELEDQLRCDNTDLLPSLVMGLLGLDSSRESFSHWEQMGCKNGYCVNSFRTPSATGESMAGNGLVIWSPVNDAVFLIDVDELEREEDFRIAFERDLHLETLTLSLLTDLGQTQTLFFYKVIPYYPDLTGMREWVTVPIRKKGA